MIELLCGFANDGCGPEDLIVWVGFLISVAVAWQLRKYAGPVVHAMEDRVEQLEKQNKQQQIQLDVLREEVGAAVAIRNATSEMRRDHDLILKGQAEMMAVLERMGQAQERTARVLEELLSRRRSDAR